MSKELKFKVGDKVLISIPNPEHVIQSARKYNGQVVEIVEIRDDGLSPYRIEGYELF